MIRDLHTLKESFKGRTKALEDTLSKRRWGPKSLLKLEEDIILAAYELQKLLEEDVLPNAYGRTRFPMTSYAHKSTLEEGSHWRDFKLHYAMGEPAADDHPPLFICHQIIHNAVWAFDITKAREIAGLYVTSTHQRKNALYRVDTDALMTLFRSASDSLASY